MKGVVCRVWEWGVYREETKVFSLACAVTSSALAAIAASRVAFTRDTWDTTFDSVAEATWDVGFRGQRQTRGRVGGETRHLREW